MISIEVTSASGGWGWGDVPPLNVFRVKGGVNTICFKCNKTKLIWLENIDQFCI